MDTLIASLERIEKWLQEFDPDTYERLQPGLSDSEIDETTSGLPFRLPLELRKLYGWANGLEPSVYRLFPGISFLPHQESVQQYWKLLQEAKSQAVEWGRNPSEIWWNKQWLPFMAIDKGDYFILGSEQQQERSPIFLYDYNDWDDLRPKLRYMSIADMMFTIAECYEEGAYYFSNSYEQQDLDEELAEEIRLRYNPQACVTYYDIFTDEEFFLPG